MANQENANIFFPRCQDQFLEFLADKSIPLPEYSTVNHTKPKRNYLRKGTGLLRYHMKPKQNIRKQTLDSSEMPKDKSDKKLVPDIDTSEDGIKAKRALKRPHNNTESCVDNPSNVSFLNDSVVSCYIYMCVSLEKLFLFFSFYYHLNFEWIQFVIFPMLM